jgi:hypothetical protein
MGYVLECREREGRGRYLTAARLQKQGGRDMSRTGAKRHVHKYYRADDGLWYCALETCTHYMPLNVAHQIVNKMSVCWNCGETFALDILLMRERKPVCDDCSARTTGGPTRNQIADWIEAKEREAQKKREAEDKADKLIDDIFNEED